MPDLDDHPFLPRNIELENGGADTSERAWLRWAALAEQLLGHDLDGDDFNSKGCGYSIDEAVTMFDAGVAAAAYVATVRSRSRYSLPAQQ